MTTFASHTTAVLYWLHATKRPDASSAIAFHNPEATEEACLPLLAGLATNASYYEVLTNKKAHKTPRLTQHTTTKKPPMGDFLSLFKGMAVSSPELCFLQIANRVDLIDLIEFGYCLCGTYAYSEYHANGFCPRIPLTSVKALQQFIETHSDYAGSKQALRALRYVHDESASPAETASAMAITCVNSLGGYGFTGAVLNYRIELSNRNKGVAHKKYYVADICWPKQKVIVEYDSATFHESIPSIDNDSRKRNALLNAGWNVISLTKQQLYNETDMDVFARILSKQLKKRLNIRVLGFELKKKHLRDRTRPKKWCKPAARWQ